MSYILDALRRAESERDRGQVPGLHAQPAPGPVAATPTRPTAVGPALALGLGLLLVAGLAWWAWPRGTAPETAVVSTTVPATVPANGGAAAPAVVASAVATSVVTVPAPAATAPGPVATPEPPPLPVVVSAPPPPSPPTPSRAVPTPTPAPAAASAPPTVRLADMTAQQRRDWPPLTLGGAVHSDNPASRFIIVNGQLVREGEEAAPGISVERIDARAAILRWRDLRVELPF